MQCAPRASNGCNHLGLRALQEDKLKDAEGNTFIVRKGPISARPWIAHAAWRVLPAWHVLPAWRVLPAAACMARLSTRPIGLAMCWCRLPQPLH